MARSNFIYLFFFIISFLGYVWSKEVLTLEGTNFELTITAYRYLAVLFYDDSEKGERLLEQWKTAASLLDDDFPDDCEIGMVRLHDLDTVSLGYCLYLIDKWERFGLKGDC